MPSRRSNAEIIGDVAHYSALGTQYSRDHPLENSGLLRVVRLSPITWPTEHAAGQCRRTLAAIDFDLSVDDYIVNPNWILIWVLESRAIDDRPRVKNRDVPEITSAKLATLMQTYICGR